MDSRDIDCFAAISRLYLLAAKIHFTSFAFFIDRQLPLYFAFLTNAYESATSYIQMVLDIDMNSNSLLLYCPTDILKTITSASCILIKVLNSSYAIHFDAMQGKSLFNSAILTIRSISLRKNDFPDRLAEVLARMWRAAGSGLPRDRSIAGQHDPLELRIRSRMSVSHVYDCVWGWRRTLQSQGPSHSRTAPLVSPVQQSDTTLPRLQTAYGTDYSFGISTLQDFELLNSLEWTFDDNALFSFQQPMFNIMPQ